MNRAQAAAIARKAKESKAPPLHIRFWSKVNRLSDGDCWPWLASVRRKDEGYGAFWFEGRHHPSSRIAWLLTNGDIEYGLVVCHHCDNPNCCNPAHLFLGTPKDNNSDRISKGRQCKGSQQRNAVLNDDLVRNLRILAKSVGVSEAARRLGINRATAWDACNRRWRHV